MGKKKEAKVEEAKTLNLKLSANGEAHRPLPWAAPFPASVPDDDGKETVFVRASLAQDVILNGKMHKAGVHTIPCDFAHSHAHILSAVKE